MDGAMQNEPVGAPPPEPSPTPIKGRRTMQRRLREAKTRVEEARVDEVAAEAATEAAALGFTRELAGDEFKRLCRTKAFQRHLFRQIRTLVMKGDQEAMRIAAQMQ